VLGRQLGFVVTTLNVVTGRTVEWSRPSESEMSAIQQLRKRRQQKIVTANPLAGALSEILETLLKAMPKEMSRQAVNIGAGDGISKAKGEGPETVDPLYFLFKDFDQYGLILPIYTLAMLCDPDLALARARASPSFSHSQLEDGARNLAFLMTTEPFVC